MISALRMKSVRTALAMVRFSCSGELPRRRHVLLGLGGVPGEALVHLVGALVGEEATTEDQDHRQQPREELPEQHRGGEDEEQLVRSEPMAICLMIGSSRSRPTRGGTAGSRRCRRPRRRRPWRWPDPRQRRRRPRWLLRCARARRRRRGGRTVRRPWAILRSSGSGGASGGLQPIGAAYAVVPRRLPASEGRAQASTVRRMTQRHLAICRSRTKPNSRVQLLRAGVQVGATLRRPLLGLFRVGLDDASAGPPDLVEGRRHRGAATPLPRSCAGEDAADPPVRRIVGSSLVGAAFLMLGSSGGRAELAPADQSSPS